MSSALFGTAARANSKHLVEFKAGKMSLKGKMVHADTRKGLVYVYQADDGLMHFCWKDRTSGSVEDDLIIFPDDCEYKAIPQCTDGRAFVLKFKSTARKLFFWMQESSTAKDEEFARKINDALNNPPTPGSQSSGRLGASSAQALLGGELRDSDLQSLIGNISQQQLLQILGSGVPGMLSGSSTTSAGGGRPVNTVSTASPTPAATPTTTPAPNLATPAPAATPATAQKTPASGTARAPIQLSDLQNILSGITPAEPKPEVDLSLGLTGEALQPLLSDAAFVAGLAPHLPPGPPLPPAQRLQGTVSSPHFQQAVALFSHALGTGQLGPLVQQFGLGDAAVAAAQAADMPAFLKALGDKKPADKDDKDKDGKDDEEKMSVD